MYQQYSYEDRADKRNAAVKIIYGVSLLAAAVLGALQYFQVKRYYNAVTGLFENGSSYKILYAVLAVFVVTGFAAYFFVKKESYHRSLRDGITVRFFSAVALISLCADTVVRFMSRVIVYGEAYGEKAPALQIVLVVTALMSAAYFIAVTKGMGEGRGKYRVMSFLGLLLIIHAIFRVMASYFGIKVSYNSPVWNLSSFAAISMLLFALLETRFWLKRPKPVFYHAAASAATLLNVVSAAATIAYSDVAHTGLSDTFCYALFQLAMTAYIASRILSR